MFETFSRPRIEGRFSGDRMRAWDTVWGKGTADLVIENSYVTIKNSVASTPSRSVFAEKMRCAT